MTSITYNKKYFSHDIDDERIIIKSKISDNIVSIYLLEFWVLEGTKKEIILNGMEEIKKL